jgi:hypothetical protein
MTTIACAIAYGREIMCDEQVGDVGLLLDAQEQTQDAIRHQRVEGRGDLVADDEFGPSCERAGDAHALLLPARELSRVAVGELRRQLDLLQEFGDPIAPLTPFHAEAPALPGRAVVRSRVGQEH